MFHIQYIYKHLNATYRSEILVGLVGTGAHLLLVVLRLLATGELTYVFLGWNIFLAWVGWACGVWVAHSWRRRGYRVQKLVLGFLWLVFLPNTFYILTDLIHPVFMYDRIPNFGGGDFATVVSGPQVIYDIAMIMLAVWVGWYLGMMSLRALFRRWVQVYGYRAASIVVILISAASSFAIYLGRSPRLNSWDVVARPHVFAQDVVKSVSDMHTFSAAYMISACFFLAINVIFWSLELMHPTKQK